MFLITNNNYLQTFVMFRVKYSDIFKKNAFIKMEKVNNKLLFLLNI